MDENPYSNRVSRAAWSWGQRIGYRIGRWFYRSRS